MEQARSWQTTKVFTAKYVRDFHSLQLACRVRWHPVIKTTPQRRQRNITSLIVVVDSMVGSVLVAVVPARNRSVTYRYQGN